MNSTSRGLLSVGYYTDNKDCPLFLGKLKQLAEYLQKKGPKALAYYEFNKEMLSGSGDIINPVHPGKTGPIGIIHYRNNTVKHAKHYGPSVYNPLGVDLWCAGADYDDANPSRAWAINNWE